ncbi:MAG: hypothetical protein ACLUW6_00505 [Coriobacteriaceae bacterium]
MPLSLRPQSAAPAPCPSCPHGLTSGNHVPGYQVMPAAQEASGAQDLRHRDGLHSRRHRPCLLRRRHRVLRRFFPQSTIIGMDISGKTPEDHQMLDEVERHTFKVEGGSSLTLDATDMGMALDSQSIADGFWPR